MLKSFDVVVTSDHHNHTPKHTQCGVRHVCLIHGGTITMDEDGALHVEAHSRGPLDIRWAPASERQCYGDTLTIM